MTLSQAAAHAAYAVTLGASPAPGVRIAATLSKILPRTDWGPVASLREVKPKKMRGFPVNRAAIRAAYR